MASPPTLLMWSVWVTSHCTVLLQRNALGPSPLTLKEITCLQWLSSWQAQWANTSSRSPSGTAQPTEHVESFHKGEIPGSQQRHCLFATSTPHAGGATTDQGAGNASSNQTLSFQGTSASVIAGAGAFSE